MLRRILDARSTYPCPVWALRGKSGGVDDGGSGKAEARKPLLATSGEFGYIEPFKSHKAQSHDANTRGPVPTARQKR